MKDAIYAHKALLKSSSSPNNETIEKFVARFEMLDDITVNSNSFSYVINLNTLQYEYVSDFCNYFTGLAKADFKKAGMDILPQIMVKEDFKRLSTEIFPEMENAYKSVDNDLKPSVMFELYYRFEGVNDRPPISAVEYSTYAKFDANGNPTMSTGMCYESPLQINGVRGIVRVKTKDGQETIYDRMVLHDLDTLTITELKLAELLAKGRSQKDIAVEMNVSIHTVKTHFRNIYKKLNINRASELINHLNSN